MERGNEIMFLAIHEVKKEKLRYGLVIAVILLVAYLIFILSALAQGLAGQNTAAVNSWKTQSVLLSKDANGNLAQSMVTKQDMPETSNKNQVTVGLAQGILKSGNARQAATFIGLSANGVIQKQTVLQSGHWANGDSEVVLSDQLKSDGFKLNQRVQMGQSNQEYTVVGFAKNALYNMAPVVYGSLHDWAAIKGVSSEFSGSGIVSQGKQTTNNTNLQVLSKKQLFDKMPGYAAQNQTFLFMIAFLIVISIVIVAIFLYILTMQKIDNLAVLRAQGIPSRYLIQNTLVQTVLIMVVAVGLGTLLAGLTAQVIPTSVPMRFDLALILWTAITLVATGLIGAIIPMRIIAKIDPVSVIGG